MTSVPPLYARFAKAWNRRFVDVAGKLPPFGVITHTGRTSGREYRTPVNAFPKGDLLTVALPYGAKTDWVLNVMAAGGGELTYRGRTRHMHNVRILDRESVPGLPLPTRVAAPVVKVLIADLA